MAANPFQKLAIQPLVNQNAILRALEVIQSKGRALPCVVKAVQGQLVLVEFDVSGEWTLPNIIIPKLESRWLQNPTQVGDMGFTTPVDLYVDKISGQSTITPILGSTPPNLSPLVFAPVSNVNFSKPDANAALVQGPNGAIIQTVDGSSKITVNLTMIQSLFGSSSIVINSSGVTIMGKDFLTHTHSGVQPGEGITGGVS
jgi:hypothetical protein